jgi:hypothetical protein
MLLDTPAVVVENPGPLKVAVRMWRQRLVLRLKPPETMRMPQPASHDEACALLADHAAKAAAATRDLVLAIAPPGHDAILAAQVGPLGLQAIIHPGQQQFGATQWPVSYRPSDGVTVFKETGHGTGAAMLTAGEHWGHGTVERLTHLSPEAAAVSRVRAAIDEMTTPSWLAP